MAEPQVMPYYCWHRRTNVHERPRQHRLPAHHCRGSGPGTVTNPVPGSSTLRRYEPMAKQTRQRWWRELIAIIRYEFRRDQ